MPPMLIVVARWLLQDVLERRGRRNLTFVQVARKHRGLALDQRAVVKYEAQAVAPGKLRQLGCRSRRACGGVFTIPYGQGGLLDLPARGPPLQPVHQPGEK